MQPHEYIHRSHSAMGNTFVHMHYLFHHFVNQRKIGAIMRDTYCVRDTHIKGNKDTSLKSDKIHCLLTSSLARLAVDF